MENTADVIKFTQPQELVNYLLVKFQEGEELRAGISEGLLYFRNQLKERGLILLGGFGGATLLKVLKELIDDTDLGPKTIKHLYDCKDTEICFFLYGKLNGFYIKPNYLVAQKIPALA